MKILQVIHTFPPISQAGSEIYTFNLSKELAKHHELFVAYRVADANRPEYDVQRGKYEGLGIWTINNTFRNFKSFEDTYRNDEIAARFGKFLDEIRPDVVHFQHVTCLSTTCVHEAKKRKIPVVFTLHDYWLICPRGQFVKRDLTLSEEQDDVSCVQCMAYQLEIEGGAKKVTELLSKLPPKFSNRESIINSAKRAMSRFSARQFFSRQRKGLAQIRERKRHIHEMCNMVDLFISPSQFLIGKFKEFGISESKMVFSDNGFDLKPFTNVQKIHSEKIRFGYVGSLIPTKGIHVLIDAFNGITDPRAELHIWGKDIGYDGVNNYGEYLNGLVKNPVIHLHGEYANSRIAEVLAGIDVLVVPSIWYENSPLTIHEAFMAHIPLIVSGIGGMAELIQDGVNGLHFRMGDAEDLKNTMNRLLERRELIAEMAFRAPKVKTIEENCTEILAVYERVKK